ncbi:hypothetical protein MTO96_035903, partial [Rhipicephalus appendiculatus]
MSSSDGTQCHTYRGFLFTMAAFICGATVVPSKGGLSPEDFVDIINTHK